MDHAMHCCYTSQRDELIYRGMIEDHGQAKVGDYMWNAIYQRGRREIAVAACMFGDGSTPHLHVLGGQVQVIWPSKPTSLKLPAHLLPSALTMPANKWSMSLFQIEIYSNIIFNWCIEEWLAKPNPTPVNEYLLWAGALGSGTKCY